MASSDVLIPFIRSWEGGWSNDPADSGGATMHGITLATYIRWRENNNLPRPDKNDLRNISDQEWRDIFRVNYWNKLRADDIHSQAVANMAVDWYWHSGVTAIRTLQRLSGTTVDDIVGPKTIAAINRCNPVELFSQLRDFRIKYLSDLVMRRPSNKKYLAGWLRRVNSIKYDELILNK